MVAVLLFFTRPLQNVPNAALGAVVISAVLRLIEVGSLRRLWHIRRMEFVVAISTTLGAVVIGLLEGIVIAVALSVLDFVRRASRPHDAIEGRIRGRHGFFDTARYLDAATEPGFVLYRFDAPLFYANIERFFQRARELVETTPGVEWFVLDTAPIRTSTRPPRARSRSFETSWPVGGYDSSSSSCSTTSSCSSNGRA